MPHICIHFAVCSPKNKILIAAEACLFHTSTVCLYVPSLVIMNSVNLFPFWVHWGSPGRGDVGDSIRPFPKMGGHITTPGRIIDLINNDSLRLGEVQYLVLDEVDQMLAVGFEEDVEVILEKLPTKRQSMLFSRLVG
ncbi:uncharacterized protein LOC130784991 [Actinidia eriantha]|uniref:uncharacterized protein LOC130784991 n=1 Tax=Actinidia eriantha TaxID=165200 RepID=UPI00258AE80C|nr:uncharacterized protein LOC130784991 [Actinidia eriantha]